MRFDLNLASDISKSRLSSWEKCILLELAGAEVTMGSAVERTDEHVREYLIYRGFTSTLKHLDSDIKADKEKGFRVRRGNTGGYIFASA